MISNIRNFCIIAHIDHGKSTLADRFLEITNTLPPDKIVQQTLDRMELERERGITIKAQPVRMFYKNYILNLIDTPGHFDFSYEVSRSLKAVEGAVLLVDATEGIQAQTLANFYAALEADLEIIPVVNKIDLPNAQPEKVAEQISHTLGFKKEEIIFVSAKTGEGVEKVLDAVIEKIPPPEGNPQAPLKALIFDSHYDSYRGVVVHIRLFDGSVKKGDQIILMATKTEYEVSEVGLFTPDMQPTDVLQAGQIGYLIAGIKEISDAKVGDTITLKKNPAAEPLPGYVDVKPLVFAGIYPTDPDDYELLASALQKLKLNDASLVFEPENSPALGHGFRTGFLGLLHMEIIQERLEREFGLDLVFTSPNVVYEVVLKTGEKVLIDNPGKLPPADKILEIREPFVRATIIVPKDYIGKVFELIETRRAEFKGMDYIDPTKVIMNFEMPLSEMITEFHDRLKSATRGFATFDYEFAGYKPQDLVKLDILVAGKPVDTLSVIVHRDKAYYVGRKIVDKLKELIPRQLFEVAIQAAIGSRVIARATIKPLRKDVLAKCYGGDVTRKKKLLEKQKEGKKRLKKIGHVEVPQEAFLSLLKLEK